MKITRQNYCSPLLSFDIYLDHYHKTIKQLRSKADIRLIEDSIRASIPTQLENTITNEHYDAIVVTDAKQTIVWVSDGFYEMTGYSSRYAIGRQPSFLQGKDTKETTKKSIKTNLNFEKEFTTSIVNYKKNGEEYLCELKLFPLRDHKKQITHYLALERKLEAA
jgi:PAS domain S-box-containing protein